MLSIWVRVRLDLIPDLRVGHVALLPVVPTERLARQPGERHDHEQGEKCAAKEAIHAR